MLMDKENILNFATRISFQASLIGVPYANYVWMALVFYDLKKEEIENQKRVAM